MVCRVKHLWLRKLRTEVSVLHCHCAQHGNNAQPVVCELEAGRRGGLGSWQGGHPEVAAHAEMDMHDGSSSPLAKEVEKVLPMDLDASQWLAINCLRPCKIMASFD